MVIFIVYKFNGETSVKMEILENIFYPKVLKYEGIPKVRSPMFKNIK
jgi:hypothetical protein